MAKNKNRLSFEAQLSRHPHDISSAYSASLSTGMIIPQWYDIAQPGDKYIMKPKMFTRLQNVVKAFLGEVDINVKIFFIPLQMLYTPFGQIFAQTNDVLSSNFRTLGSKDTFPMLNIEDSVNTGTDLHNFWFGHKECFGIETARLLDSLGNNPYVILNETQRNNERFEPEQYDVDPIDVSMCSNPKISPWLFAAYQAVYQKKFRNDEFEKFNITSFNFDQYFQSDVFASQEFIKLRYAQRPSDYFTKTRVSPIASSINKLAPASSEGQDDTNILNGGTLNSLLGKVSSWLSSQPRYNSPSKAFDIGDLVSGSFNGLSSFDYGSPAFDSVSSSQTVSNIRAAFALDKFLRVYGRAGKTYDEQILAHFGVKIPHDVKHDLTEIAHIHGALKAEPIYATATIGADATGSSVLGDVGGQGQLTIESSKDIKFTAPVHGVLMAVAYAVTKPRYFGTFDKLNLLGSRIDFPIPEFDKLGAQPMYSWEYDPQDLGFISTNTPTLSARMGWQNRYQQFKEKFNRCGFVYAPATAFGLEQGATYSSENKFEPWILSRQAFFGAIEDVQSTVNATELWETPTALNSVMDVPYNGEWTNDFFVAPHLMCQTDPILTDFYMDCTKVSWMSPTGEPDL